MAQDEMSRWGRWWYALKPGSWPKVLVPMVLGQALGVAASGRLDWRGLVLGLAFTVCDAAFIVWLNDWADEDVDRLKRQMFPNGCSPKTIPDGILPSRALLMGGLVAAALAAAVAFAGGWWLGLPWLGWAGLGALGVFALYTLPPVKLNYRGGGELLEMVGVGVVLPWWNAYAQGGALWHGGYTALGGFAALSLASALASGLSDEVSDRAGGKRTFTTALGNGPVRRAVEASLVASVVAWGLSAWLTPAPATPWWALGAASCVVAWYGLRVRRASSAARTNAFGAQKRYKLHLHRAIWHSALVLAGLVVVGVVASSAL